MSKKNKPFKGHICNILRDNSSVYHNKANPWATTSTSNSGMQEKLNLAENSRLKHREQKIHSKVNSAEELSSSGPFAMSTDIFSDIAISWNDEKAGFESQEVAANQEEKGSKSFFQDFHDAAGGSAGKIPHLSAMEQAFGMSFSNVPSYTGQADALASMGASAVTDGTSVVFGDTAPSLSTVAHEMAHIVQGRRNGGGAGGKKDLSAATDACEVEAAQAAEAVVQGQKIPELKESLTSGLNCELREGFSKGRAAGNKERTLVDERGNLGEEADQTRAITRIPLDGLSTLTSSRAIVMVPGSEVLQDKAVNMVVFYHGAGAGASNWTNGTGNPVDIDAYALAQQLAASGEPTIVIAVEWQGSKGDGGHDSPRKKPRTHPGHIALPELINEVFGYLQQNDLLSAENSIGRKVLAGHSKGGETAIREARDPDTEAAGIDGLFLYDGQGGKIPDVQVEKILGEKLEKERSILSQLTEQDALDWLSTHGFVFRAYAQDSFIKRNKKTSVFLDTFFKQETVHTLNPAVLQRWAENYSVTLLNIKRHHSHIVRDEEKRFRADHDPNKGGNFQESLDALGK